MKYITIKRFKRRGDFLYFGDKKICVARSFAAHEFFARNDDNKGLERGKISHSIIKTLGGFDKNPALWEKIFSDKVAQKYRRAEHKDF